MPKRTRKKKINGSTTEEIQERVKILDNIRKQLQEDNQKLTYKIQIDEMKKVYNEYKEHHLVHDLRYLFKHNTFLKDLTEYQLSHEVESMLNGVNELMEDSIIKARENPGTSKWHYAYSHLANVKHNILNGKYVDISLALASEEITRIREELRQTKDKLEGYENKAKQ